MIEYHYTVVSTDSGYAEWFTNDTLMVLNSYGEKGYRIKDIQGNSILLERKIITTPKEREERTNELQ